MSTDAPDEFKAPDGEERVKRLFPNIPLVDSLPPPTEELIKTLQELLAMAKDGQLSGIAFCAFSIRRETMLNVAGACPMSDTIAQLETLKFRLLMGFMSGPAGLGGHK